MNRAKYLYKSVLQHKAKLRGYSQQRAGSAIQSSVTFGKGDRESSHS